MAQHHWESVNMGVHVYHYICRPCGLAAAMPIEGECDQSELA